jgi:hypothetical protein
MCNLLENVTITIAITKITRLQLQIPCKIKNNRLPKSITYLIGLN